MSLRIRLILLILIAALPVLAVQVVSRLGERQAERQQIAATALRLAALEGERVSRLVDIAYGVTTTLVQLPAVLDRDGPACVERIRDVLTSLPEFAGIGAFAPDGTSFCHTGGETSVYAGDRSYFREAVRGRRFVGSAHLVGRLVREPVMVFAMPAIDEDGELRAVIILNYALRKLPEYLHTKTLPKGASVDLIDESGTLMARLPAASIEHDEALAAVLDRLRGGPGGTVVAAGADGVKRVFGYVRLPRPAGFEVVVGLPVAPALAEIDTLMARLPAASIEHDEALAAVLDRLRGGPGGTVVAAGADGVKRVFGYVRLPRPAGFEVVVGLPVAPALAEIDTLMWRDIAAVALIFGIAAMAALLTSEYGISQPMASLQAAAGRFARGDLAARARIGRGAAKEVAALASSLNEMADAIAVRERALSSSEEFGRRILASSQDCIEVLDLEGRLLSINAFGCKALEIDDCSAVVGAYYSDLWDEDVPGELPEALAQARRGEAARFLGRLHTASGHQMWWDISISPIADSGGRPERLLVVSRDMTELKRAEQHRELLMAELDHRVKNALAAIQSMARQVLEPGRRADAFVERIAAMATAYSLLSNSRWEGSALSVLMSTMLALHQERISTEGPEVQLDAQTTQVLAVVVHELATNAEKHGALSGEGGQVEVRWEMDAEGRNLRLEWHEHGGPAADRPAAAGFGFNLLRRSVEHELGGRVELDFRPEGLRCRLLLPLRAPHGRAEAYNVRLLEPQPSDAPAEPRASAGGRVLVLEDSVLVAMEIEAVLTGAGYAVLGPAATVAEAMQLMELRRVDAAVLDVNLGGGETSFPVASALRDEGTPFIFLTGYSNRAVFPPQLLDVPRVAKPFQEAHLLKTLAAACGEAEEVV